ncbi:MAG: 4-hydroxybenzoate polyprenyltransferase [Myxococcota bacterium]|jgi:4-hydroxybenzoate polyprenyltransferase
MTSQLAKTMRMIKFEHSVFALPFALAGAWIAAEGVPPLYDLLLLVIAAVCARSAAMAYNRVRDRHHDASNERTADRELVSGAISVRYAVRFTLLCSLAFVGVSFLLAPICGWLSLPCLVVLLGYSHLKDFSYLCHLGLGVALGLAPAGAWLAVNKSFDGEWQLPLLIGAGVSLWVAGFDLLYAIQDIGHDLQQGTFSFPAKFGIGATKLLSLILFASALLLWHYSNTQLGTGLYTYLGEGIIAILLAIELGLVHYYGEEKIPMAFFKVNAWVPMVYFVSLVADIS